MQYIYTHSVIITHDFVRFIGKFLKRRQFQLEIVINFRNVIVAPLKDYFRTTFTFEKAYFSYDGSCWKERYVVVRVVILRWPLACFRFFLDFLTRDHVYICMNYLNSWKSRAWYRTEYYITQLQRKLCPKLCSLASFLSKLCTMLSDAWRNQVMIRRGVIFWDVRIILNFTESLYHYQS